MCVYFVRIAPLRRVPVLRREEVFPLRRLECLICIEKADFLLTSYEDTNPNHVFYRTSGTSGNFQLVYGFCKPCIIKESFAPVNNFDNTNSIIYIDDNSYADALKCGIEMSKEEYENRQKNLYNYTKSLYTESLNNLRRLINV